LLLETAEGVKLGVALAAFSFEIEPIERSTPWRLGESVVL
jgi:hypothetical protein